MVSRTLGRSGLAVTPIGFGAFKIGRNEGIKYPQEYALPDEATAERLVRDVVDSGINYIDTAPAYGISEERIGRALGGANRDVIVSTKVGETFASGESHYDFSAAGIRRSVMESARRLQRTPLDLVFLHAPQADLMLLDDTDAAETLCAMKAEGLTRAVGFSGKSVAAAQHALAWADVLMVEYHADDRTHAGVIAAAAQAGIGVVVKKGFASGRLDPAAATAFVLATPGVDTLVVGSLNIEHIRQNIRYAERVRR